MLQPYVHGWQLILISYVCEATKIHRMTCDDDKIDLKCGDNSGRLLIFSATYGRTTADMCGVFSDVTNCSVDVVTKLGEVCDRKKGCSLIVSEDVFSSPCPGIPKYLSYVYGCQDFSEVSTSRTTNDPAKSTYTTTSPMPETIPTTTLKADDQAPCDCKCSPETNIDNYQTIMSDPDLVVQLTKNITNLLKIDRNVLSSTIRKKNSMTDTRESASYMGYVGIVVLVVVFGSLILLDFINMFVVRSGRPRHWKH